MSCLVLLRHGQSTWNRDGLFTGWHDCDLSPRGEEEARDAGRLLADERVAPDVVHTSLLTRAVRTANLTLDAAARAWLPVRRSWRLNERHYGALQGKDKAQVREEYGEAQFRLWRRSYATPPPPLAQDDPNHPRLDDRYRGLAPDLLPAGECLADVVTRVLPYWYDAVVADLRSGCTPLVVAHGNSLRALVMHLDDIGEADVAGLEIPTGVPLVYEFDGDLRTVGSRYLGHPDDVRQRAEAVARQGGSPAP